MENKSLKSLPSVLTPKEAAKVLRIGKNSVYALIKSNTLPSVRVGRKILISKKEVQRFIDSSICYNNDSSSDLILSVKKRSKK